VGLKAHIICDLADVLEERKEHGADIPRRPEAIHLYGVDCMSTSECLSYFGDYGPTFAEWIDDSSCNILFEDEFTAKRALIGCGKPLPPDNSAPDTAGATHKASYWQNLGSTRDWHSLNSMYDAQQHCPPVRSPQYDF